MGRRPFALFIAVRPPSIALESEIVSVASPQAPQADSHCGQVEITLTRRFGQKAISRQDELAV